VTRRDLRAHSREGGFSLVELLLTLVLTAIVTGAVLAVIGPAQRLALAQPEASDLQQRLRVGVDAVRGELLLAGAGFDAGPALGPLGGLIAPVLPYRAFGASADPQAGRFYRADAVSVLYVSDAARQTVLAAPLAPGGAVAALAAAPNCPPASPGRVCGLGAGDTVLLVDRASHWSLHRVASAGGGVVLASQGAAPSHTYAPGTAIAGVRAGTYYLSAGGSGPWRLMRHDGWRTSSPVVDDVVRLGFGYVGEAAPPRLTGAPLDGPGPWTTYGPPPPPIGAPAGAWPGGENCAFRVVGETHAPRLAWLSPEPGALVALTPEMLTDGPWCPDAGSPTRFDADLLRVRRVRVSLRVQAAAAALRGPAGALFARGGTSRAGDLWVPDLEVAFDVAPRNLAPAR
jgi:hypothetical protein